MDDETLKNLLGPEVVEKLELFSQTMNAANSQDERMKRAINNGIDAAALIKAYHTACMITGFSNEQAFILAGYYGSLLWRKSLGLGG